jgi:hypothetical protein
METTREDVMSQATVKTLNAIFHADLSDAHPDEDHWISVRGKRIPLVPHTHETRTAALAAAPHLLAGRATRNLTHQSAASVALPVHSVIRVHVRNSQKHFKNPKSETGVGFSALYIPPPQQQLAAMADGAPYGPDLPVPSPGPDRHRSRCRACHP